MGTEVQRNLRKVRGNRSASVGISAFACYTVAPRVGAWIETKQEETRKFIDSSFRDGTLKTTGTDIDKILPPASRFGGGGGNRAMKKQSVIEKLMKFFEKYMGLV